MNPSSLEALADKSLLVILAYAPAGLGHLRVTDALYDGLPKSVDPILLGSHDKLIQSVHRFTSTHLIPRKIFEWFQSGPLTHQFNSVFSLILRSHTSHVYEQINTILDQKPVPLKKVLVVATHFGLAHQIAAIKNRIEKERHIQIYLAVVVTDDTPESIWYVKRANLIVAPSQKTKDRFLILARSQGEVKETIVFLPYPLSPAFCLPLTKNQFSDKVCQLTPDQDCPIHISLPISGAAVGTQFSSTLIDRLKETSPRFIFHVVSKTAFYTQNFLSQMVAKSHVDLHASPSDREVVSEYDQIIKTHTISLEIIKPSEQSFKALLSPKTKGGVILLFSESVGKQERDNLDFLRRHFLIPAPSLNQALWQWAKRHQNLNSHQEKLFQEACAWRGICLPHEPTQAADFIWWLLDQRLLLRMLLCKTLPRPDDPHPEELKTNGVSQFWHQAAQLITT